MSYPGPNDKCDCPIHTMEDTTKVKYAAYAVIIFFLGLFLFTQSGCVTTDPKDEPYRPMNRKI